LRRLFLSALLAAALVPAFAQAPAWPAKPVRFVNNFPPGGPSDLIARSIADVLQRQSGQAFVVENKAGASGNIGADAVAKAPADGYTVLFGIDSSSAGSGSPGHLAAEVITEATGAKITHVPYKGNTPAVMAVLSGEVSAGVLATPGMLPHVKAGKITALAVTSRKRSTLAPDIPTVAEAGLPQLEQEVLYLAMVPAATPEPVVQALQKAVADALARQDVRARLENLDLHYEGLAGASAAKRLAELSARYGQVIRATGMKVE
jgi:tripartite-type tricarboxylate transporter receptor subunit TctC